MPYCPQCGSETEAEAAFCGDCGTRLEEQATPPPEQKPPTARPAAKGGASLRSLLGSLVVLGPLALGLAALYDAAANDGDWADSIFGGGGGEEAIVAAPSPTAEETVAPSPTVEPSPTEEPSPGPTVTPPPEEPTVVPPDSGFATPEEAIGAFLAENEIAYAGDCESASVETDIGSRCSSLWEERYEGLIYLLGLAFTDQTEMWLLVSPFWVSDGWTVVDAAPFVGLEEGPPWP